MTGGDNPHNLSAAYLQDEPPPPSTPLGQEFLFHLYRGSALLEDNQVDEAKSELERALSLQPRDVEGQSLLGMVYFRLGHYPRAIQIYEDLVHVRPAEIAPKVNLALCYLKTGQSASARILLEQVVQAKPDHARAWGYLGLAYQRLGDLDKASVSFERAGRPQLAERVRLSQKPEQDGAVSDSDAGVREIAHSDASDALAVSERRRSTLPPPGAENADGHLTPDLGSRPSVAVAASRFASSNSIVFPPEPSVTTDEHGVVLVTVAGRFGLRPDYVQAVIPAGTAFRSRPLRRKLMASGLDEPLGAPTAPMVELEGAGQLVLLAPSGRQLTVLRLDGEPVYLREDRLVAFEPTVSYNNGRLALDAEHIPLVHLSGGGHVVFAGNPRLATLDVRAGKPVEAVADRVLGWMGRLLPRALLPAEATTGLARVVVFSGHGHLLLEWA